MSELTGQVTRGINNIFTVLHEGESYQCRIWGKQLKTVQGEYNALAVGDWVSFTITGTGEGMIKGRLDRRNAFVRWHARGGANQTVVANMDLIICVSSAASPPFRPRFIDRVIACSQNVEVMVVLNKSDLSFSEFEEQRFKLYEELGYQILSVSAITGENLDALHQVLVGKTVAFVGQSGVGKSTLINALLDSDQRTREICAKYDRGKHTTNHSLLLAGPDYRLVDTPGVREIMVPYTEKTALFAAFPEFASYAPACAFDPCFHDEEPDCRVQEAVEEGAINSDRYESYLRMLYSLEEKEPSYYGSSESSESWRKRRMDNEYKEY
ncbi:MAG TPA: ribosome small subunit-dependent GTPase A [Sphaerochaeta sp.]|nr:ribosome small subunit-dependent GTPase A [Sphaerochaeta sp.]